MYTNNGEVGQESYFGTIDLQLYGYWQLATGLGWIRIPG